MHTLSFMRRIECEWNGTIYVYELDICDERISARTTHYFELPVCIIGMGLKGFLTWLDNFLFSAVSTSNIWSLSRELVFVFWVIRKIAYNTCKCKIVLENYFCTEVTLTNFTKRSNNAAREFFGSIFFKFCTANHITYRFSAE